MGEKTETVAWIRRELQEHAEEKYKEFHQSLVPGLQNMMGVRIPILRQIAQKGAKEYTAFVQAANTENYEELMLRGMMLGYAKLTKKEQKEELISFIPLIQNWAVCDCCCSTYKFMKKDQEEWFAFLLPYTKSKQEYELRFALVCMLDYFVKEAFIQRVLKILAEVRHEGYYVKMAAAWAVSVCYVKFPKQTEQLFAEKSLDVFTHNKAIQKIRESYRVSKEDKERLKQMKRKE